ncbi:hypothetical protein JAAARDRAFT_63723 [Jaapia argillacea MUCL 33604]|uniref:Uncharacterized protein n=1 Tax=Jaapia argillacea MUCL 33604 TaxID=933084 RepID=A0A067P410_9AGAM|nr:hypothetical protein JAAARDRAFT_63723 [Jaapia argillacea MUCL 33604]
MHTTISSVTRGLRPVPPPPAYFVLVTGTDRPCPHVFASRRRLLSCSPRRHGHSCTRTPFHHLRRLDGFLHPRYTLLHTIVLATHMLESTRLRAAFRASPRNRNSTFRTSSTLVLLVGGVGSLQDWRPGGCQKRYL